MLKDIDKKIFHTISYPEKPNSFKTDIPWHPSMNEMCYNQVFFKHIFPHLKGKAAELDEYLSLPRCSCFKTIQVIKSNFITEMIKI